MEEAAQVILAGFPPKAWPHIISDDETQDAVPHSSLAAAFPPADLSPPNMTMQINSEDKGRGAHGPPQAFPELGEDAMDKCLDRIRSPSSQGDTQSDCTDSSSSHTTGEDPSTIMLFVKHQLITRLMQEAYTIFNSRWAATIRTRTGYQSERTSSPPQAESLSSSRKGKRRMQDRDSPPPDGSRDKGNKRSCPGVERQDSGNLFACPFHKYDPEKYCSNPTWGVKYRSCMGPGFTTIARLK